MVGDYKLNQEEVIVEHLLKDVFDPVYTVTGLATIASYTSTQCESRQGG